MFALVYFLLTLFLIIYLKHKIFNIKVNINNYDIYNRLIWCLFFGFFGFLVLVVKIINNVLKNENKNGKQDISPFPTYLLYYTFIILMTSTISFFIFNLFLYSIGTLFYAGSASLSFFLGLYVDNFYEILNGLLKK